MTDRTVNYEYIQNVKKNNYLLLKWQNAATLKRLFSSGTISTTASRLRQFTHIKLTVATHNKVTVDSFEWSISNTVRFYLSAAVLRCGLGLFELVVISSVYNVGNVGKVGGTNALSYAALKNKLKATERCSSSAQVKPSQVLAA